MLLKINSKKIKIVIFSLQTELYCIKNSLNYFFKHWWPYINNIKKVAKQIHKIELK